ncbi:MAG: hypothetical protein ACP5HC_02425 [Caldisericum sp.]
MEVLKNKRRTYGEHLTSISIFKKFILPEIQKEIYKYRWVDLFCGEGNLIVSLNFFENFFSRFGTQIIVINDYTNEKKDIEEIIEEIITLLHSFSMKYYSNRRKLRKVIKHALV